MRTAQRIALTVCGRKRRKSALLQLAALVRPVLVHDFDDPGRCHCCWKREAGSILFIDHFETCRELQERRPSQSACSLVLHRVLCARENDAPRKTHRT